MRAVVLALRIAIRKLHSQALTAVESLRAAA